MCRGGWAALTCSQPGLTAGLRAAGRPGAHSAGRAHSGESAPRAARGWGACAPRSARRARLSASVCPRAAGVRGPCAAACACAHAGTALAWSRHHRRRRRRQSPPGPPSAAPPACPLPPRTARRSGSSALRERRRLLREARPGAGGRGPTTASAAHFAELGAGVDQWAPGGGVRPGVCGGAGPRPPRSPGLETDISQSFG